MKLTLIALPCVVAFAPAIRPLRTQRPAPRRHQSSHVVVEPPSSRFGLHLTQLHDSTLPPNVQPRVEVVARWLFFAGVLAAIAGGFHGSRERWAGTRATTRSSRSLLPPYTRAPASAARLHACSSSRRPRRTRSPRAPERASSR